MSQSGSSKAGAPTAPASSATAAPASTREATDDAAGVAVFEDPRRYQALLREREERLRLSLRAASAGSWDWDLASDRMVWSSQQYADDELAWSNEPMHYADWLARVHPDDQAATAAAVRDAAEGRIAELSVQFRIITRSGGERWLWSLGKLLRDDAGQPMRLIGISLDITDRRRGEDATARLAAIVSASDDAVVSKTLDGIVQSWNAGAERLFGYTADEMIGVSILRILPPERFSEEDTILAALRRGDRIEHYESVRVRKDGGRVDVSITVFPIRDASGRVVAAAKVARDISARKIAEATHLEDARRKDEFLATLAHELRNPLAPVRNAVHLMKMPGAGPADVEWARDVVDRQVGRMARLIDDLLDVSRITIGKIELHRERVDLAKVLADAVETSRPLIAAEAHRLVIALPAEPLIVSGDTTRLSQVFANLLNNAAKFTRRRGSIELDARRDGDHAVVRVSDNGIGIAPAQIGSIFELFTQVRAADDHTKEGGLGIGLSLARRLVEMHGGSIEAESAGAGRGSTFEVRLPLAATAESPAQPGAALAAERAQVTSRVLVVDDNRDAATSTALLLELEGCVVATAFDGLEALRQAEQFEPQVVLLDIGLPKLDGFEVCRRLRELPGGADLFIVAVTGWGEEADRERARAAGFDEHVVKPVDPNQLLRRIAQRLGAAPAIQA